MFGIISAQKRLDLEKTGCGRTLIAGADAERSVYENANKGWFR